MWLIGSSVLRFIHTRIHRGTVESAQNAVAALTSSLLVPRASGRSVESFGQPGTRTRIINPDSGD